MNKKFLTLLLLLPLKCYADFNLQQLTDISQSPEILSGQFIQEKYLAELDINLSSSGKFEYKKNKVIQWQTLEPIENLLTMTPQSIISQQGKQTLLDLQADSNPLVSLLSELFFSVLTAQWQDLALYFTFTGSIDDGCWKIELVPKDATFTQVINRIELQGDSLLRQLTFYEINGDHTEITFIKLSQ